VFSEIDIVLQIFSTAQAQGTNGRLDGDRDGLERAAVGAPQPRL